MPLDKGKSGWSWMGEGGGYKGKEEEVLFEKR